MRKTATKRIHMTDVVAEIGGEPQFKSVCDALLRYVVGPLIQTYGAAGKDQGIDADFQGAFGPVPTARWVFQYKFVSPTVGVARQRAALLAKYVGTKSGELDKPGVAGADVYVIMTNVPATVGLVQKLTAAWRARFPAGRLVVWDSSGLGGLLVGREFLARSFDGTREQRCREKIVLPLSNWLADAEKHLRRPSDRPMWPLTWTPTQSTDRAPGEFRPRVTESFSTAAHLGPLVRVGSNRHFDFARSVAFPVALSGVEKLSKPLDQLRRLLQQDVETMRARVMEMLPGINAGREGERDLATVVAFAVLEWQRGVPITPTVISGTSINTPSMGFTSPVELTPSLLELMPNGPPHQPAHIAEALEHVAAVVLPLRRKLWHVLELGVDAPDESGPGPRATTDGSV